MYATILVASREVAMVAKKPGTPVRGSETGRPIMVLMDLLGQRWTLRILWELREERLTFRQMRECCDQISPTVLNHRLKELREFHLIDHDGNGFGLTDQGQELGQYLLSLNDYAQRWASRII